MIFGIDGGGRDFATVWGHPKTMEDIMSTTKIPKEVRSYVDGRRGAYHKAGKKPPRGLRKHLRRVYAAARAVALNRARQRQAAPGNPLSHALQDERRQHRDSRSVPAHQRQPTADGV